LTLQEGAKRVLKLQKKLKKGIDTGSLGQHQSLTVALGKSVLCPARCHKCTTLDAMDLYDLCESYQASSNKFCPLCKAEFKNKLFYDIFYLDVPLMRLIFMHGPKESIFYDIGKQEYFIEEEIQKKFGR
jgi:hypothetical protein